MKLKIESKYQLLGQLSLKHNVSMTGYPLSYYKKNKQLYLIQCGFLFGTEKDKKALITDLKKRPECVELNIANDFAIIVTAQPSFAELFYDPRMIRPMPVIINAQEKHYIWYLASFEKEVLMKVYNLAKKHFNAELLKLQKEKITNISITKLLPELTSKQKRALEIAINNGYYNYPKKVNMERLAELMGVSYSTYQAHLKKAEGKILPVVYKAL